MAEDWLQKLVDEGVISPDQLQEALSLSSSHGISAEDALTKLGYVSAEDIASKQAAQFGYEFVDLEGREIPSSIIGLVPESVARENIVIPLERDEESLTIAIHDPMKYEVLDKLRFILNCEIKVTLASKEAIQAAINRHYGQDETESVDSMITEFTETAIDFTAVEAAEAMQVADEDDSAPVIRLVNLIISEAVNMRASDIHIEPFEDRVRVRYRIDGILVERDSPPRRLLGAIVSRIKIMARVDISEKRRPQDGRIKTTISGKDYDLRLSIMPTNHGQAVVMRILDRESIKIGIKNLGFGEENYKTFQGLIRRPNGIFLVTGPTGSGKTTTLYSALGELNRPDRKIITAEDPVEYYLQGINQVQVKAEIGLDFARIIRAMLRQAPNVILVGEMRDTETAQMGIQASLTGHLVFSTLHTNDAPGAITRMIDMGVPAYLVASSVIAVLAQRLVRVNCPKCRQPYEPPQSHLEAAGVTEEMLKGATFMKGRGCANCNKSGYKGRLGIFELMPMSSKIRELAFQGASTQDIRKTAADLGMRMMFDDGVNKVLRGITTFDEVFRVAKKVEH